LSTIYEGERTGQYSDVSGAYPVTVEFPNLEYSNKLYAVPIVGMLLKVIMLIPFLVAVYIVGIIASIAQYLLWIPVLFTGRYPNVGYTLMGGYLRWTTRCGSFLAGLSDKYPSFSFDDELGSGDPTVTFERSQVANRLWAIPLVGYVLKAIILIPHMIILGILGFVCSLAILVTWIPVLLTGTYPSWGRSLFGGTIRRSVRVMSYFYGLTDVYPPFSMS
jgi:hypothetical protein